MDRHTLVLLTAEADVKKKIKEAEHQKNEQLKSIRKEAEQALMEYRKNREAEFQTKLAKVSRQLARTSQLSMKANICGVCNFRSKQTLRGEIAAPRASTWNI